MFRRSTSTLLIVIYVAGQLAAVPHAHGGNVGASSEHDSRPHVHVSWFGHSHDDGHTHDHHHHYDVSHSSTDFSEWSSGSNDHDSNAVYLPNETGNLYLACKISGSPNPLDAVQALPVAAAIEPADHSGQLCKANFSGNCCPGTPLYLALRALRI
jgi:hypothetical protein